MRWLLTRGRFPTLAVIAVLTAWLGWHAARVGVERDNASLNTQDPETIARYEAFQTTFGSDEDMLVAVTSPTLLEPAGLRLVARLTHDLGALDGVHHVFSMTTARRLVPSPDGPVDAPLLPPLDDAPDLGARVRARLDENPEYAGILVSADRRTAGFLVEIDVRPDDDHYRTALIAAIRGMAPAVAAEGGELHLTGITVQKHDVTAYVTRDQRVLLPLALGVLAATLWWFFRRPLGVLLPLAVTGITVAWTLGAYGLAGLSVNPITALLPPVLMVLSLAVSVHVIKGWLDATEPDRVERLRGVVRHLRFPCFFCSLTTAIGFASLITSDLPAVQQFGVFAALGVVVAFVVGMTLVPIGLTWLEPPAGPSTARPHRLLQGLLQWSAVTATERPWTVLAIAGALTAASVVAIPRIQNNTDLVRFLKPEAPLYRDTLFLDTHFTGTTTLDFVVSRVDGTPLTRLEDVERLAALERVILAEQPVTSVASILGVLRQIQRAQTGTTRLALPDTPAATSAAFDLVTAAGDEPIVRKLAARDLRQARLNVHLHAVGTAVAAPLVERIVTDGRAQLGPAYRLDATGAFYHVARDSNRLVQSQVDSFSLALVLVFLAIGLLFRSVAVTVVALIPNVIPIAWTGGLMGIAGIDLSSGTAMIASAVIGLVVDDTIHYLTEYRRAYAGDPRAAVLQTSTGIGTALSMNNIVLILGFWVGCFGSFKPTIYFSLLSGITMATAMFCDLFITPACLVALDRRGWRVVAATAALVAALFVARPAVAAPDAPPPATATTEDRLVTWVAVPDETRRVGEVRLLQRGDDATVQTLLRTSLLARVVGEIRRKELANWPEGSPGHADAVRYVDALERIRDELAQARDPEAVDRRQCVLIEFVLGDDTGVVLIGDYDATDDDGPMHLVARRPRITLSDLSRDYVRRNMRLIVADAFDREGDTIDAVLGPLAPRLGGPS